MKLVQELIGLVNYWVSPTGDAHAVRDHIEWACSNVLHIRLPSTMVTEPLYNEMFNRRWLRVVISADKILADFKRLTPDQGFWLQQEATTRKLDVVDDNGNTFIRPESMAESVVGQLLT
jgi:hypothetical protein